jgi:phosphoglycolate phosphatase-like HAD superfamily hydrolase
MIKNIVFDLDGTLLDVSQSSYYLHSNCCSDFDIKPLDLLLYSELKAIGISESQILDNYYCLSDSLSSAFLALRARDIECKDVLQKHQIKAGAIELLHYLKKRGVKIYLATFRRNLINLIGQLNDLEILNYFHDIKCRASFMNYNEKDKSRMVNAWNLNLNETVIVGDTMVDARTAEMLAVQNFILKDGIFSEVFLRQKINVDKFYDLWSVKYEISKFI